MKKEGKFYVKKISLSSRYKFTASIKPDDKEIISSLIGKPGGNCDQIATPKKYQGCGLAKYLMATCFQDNSILGEDESGVDIKTDVGWAEYSETLKDAMRYCKSIIYLRCAPHGKPKPPSRVCIAYLRAGSLANYHILFSQKLFTPSLTPFDLGEYLEAEFSQDHDAFIQDYGFRWYFCKCKDDTEETCMAMAASKP